MTEDQPKRVLGWVDNQHLAMFLVGFGASSFSAGFIYVNEMGFSPFMTGVTRGLAVTILCYVATRYKNKDTTFPSAYEFKWLFARNIIMVLHNIAYAMVQFFLPLPIAITLGAISPIFVYIYDYLIYGVTINKGQTFFVVVAVIGVVLTANGAYFATLFDPTFSNESSSFTNYVSEDPVIMGWAGLVFVLVMAVHGYGVLLTKKITMVSSQQLNFHQGIMIEVISAILVPLTLESQHYKKPTIGTFLMSLVLSGLPMAVAQLCYVGGLLITKNMGIVTTFQFTSILMGLFVSTLRYGEPINPVSLVGSVAIVVGIIQIVRLKEKPQPT